MPSFRACPSDRWPPLLPLLLARVGDCQPTTSAPVPESLPGAAVTGRVGGNAPATALVVALPATGSVVGCVAACVLGRVVVLITTRRPRATFTVPSASMLVAPT